MLLIACFNVGGLQMERLLARRREMGLRLALGASRGRIVRQTVTESVLLSVMGAGVGVAVTAGTFGAIVSLLPADLPHVGEIVPNVRALVAALVVALATGLVAGAIPLGQLRRLNPADLSTGSRASALLGSWLRRGLVVTEIALSVVVLVGAGLMIRTFLILQPTHPGFDPARKIVGLVHLPRTAPQGGDLAAQELLARIRTAPGVRSAVLATNYPMSGTSTSLTIRIDDQPLRINTYRVTPGYFELMKIALVAGRTFGAADSRDAEPTVVVNREMAQRLRPDGQVLGELVVVQPPAGPRSAVQPSAGSAPTPSARRIVGIVSSTRFAAWHTRTQPEMFVPFTQQPANAF